MDGVRSKALWLGLIALLVMGGFSTANVTAQCVEVSILRAPDRARPGSEIQAVGGFSNCGREDIRVAVDWFLINPDSPRIPVGRGVVGVRAQERARETFDLRISERVPPGRYFLVMVARNRDGVLDVARTPIAITEGR